MKVKGKKDLRVERARGRAAVDAVFMPRLYAAMGPKFNLYQLKASLAANGIDRLGNPVDILSKHAEMLDRIDTIEAHRQDIQARVDVAKSAAEIDAIISTL